MGASTYNMRSTHMIHIMSRLSGVAFLVLFPGYFAYHTLLSLDVIDRFAGGLFGPVSVVIVITYTVHLALRRRKHAIRVVRTAALLGAFIAYVLVWASVHAIIEGSSTASAAAMQSIETVILWVALVVVGAHLPLRSRWFRQALHWAFFGICVFVLSTAIVHGSVFLFSTPLFVTSEGVSSYQGMSRSVFVTVLILLSMATTPARRAILTALGAMVLFLLGARSEFAAFVAVMPVAWFLWSTRRPVHILFAFTFATGATLLILGLGDTLGTSRQAQLLDLDAATSWQARQAYQIRTLESILQQPLFGDFNGHVSSDGSVGKYSHNVLSAWASYGFVGFTLYVALVVLTLLLPLLSPSGMRDLHTHSRALLLLGGATTLLLVVAKSVFWVVPALSWGLLISYERCLRLHCVKCGGVMRPNDYRSF